MAKKQNHLIIKGLGKEKYHNNWLHGMFEIYHIPLVLVDIISMGGYHQYWWISLVLVEIIGMGGYQFV